jgi:hypothetical protein
VPTQAPNRKSNCRVKRKCTRPVRAVSTGFLPPFSCLFSRLQLRRYLCKVQIRAITDGKNGPSALLRQKWKHWKRPLRRQRKRRKEMLIIDYKLRRVRTPHETLVMFNRTHNCTRTLVIAVSATPFRVPTVIQLYVSNVTFLHCPPLSSSRFSANGEVFHRCRPFQNQPSHCHCQRKRTKN